MKLWEATECHLVATRGNALCGSDSGGQSSTSEVSLGSGQVSDTGWKSLLFLNKWRDFLRREVRPGILCDSHPLPAPRPPQAPLSLLLAEIKRRRLPPPAFPPDRSLPPPATDFAVCSARRAICWRKDASMS